MYKILRKKSLNPTVTMMDIEAPLVARKAKAGQFIILRVDEDGERIPLTVADYDRAAGTVTIIYQIVGATTMRLDRLQEGDCLQDFVGPLGKPTEVEGKKQVAVVGGGVGCAIALPGAKALKEAGAAGDTVADLLFQLLFGQLFALGRALSAQMYLRGGFFGRFFRHFALLFFQNYIEFWIFKNSCVIINN